MAKLALRSLAAHKLRLGLTAVAVILGVSFVSGTLIFKDTMARSFDDIFDEAYKGTEVIVRAKQSFAATEDGFDPPIPGSVVTTIKRKVPTAVEVTGAAEGYAAIVGTDGKVVGSDWTSQIGGDWSDDPASPLQIVSGRAPRAADEVVVDSGTAEKGRLKAGDQVKVLTQGKTQPMRLTGVFTFGPLSGLSGITTYAAFAPEVAQRLMVKPGHYSSILVYGRAGVPQERLRDEVAAVLPAGYEAVTGKQEVEEGKAEIKQLLDFLGIFLLIFAGVSVFVGSFIIFNTFSMLVAQRTRELALLRAVGASRRQVTRSVLGEAAGMGLVGSTLGLAAGVGLAFGLRTLFKLFGVTLPATNLAITPATVVWSYAVGMTVTVVAAYLPARRAAKIPPVAAMRDDVALPARSLRLRLIGGTVLAVLGAAALAGGLAGEGEDAAGLVGLSAGAMFLGVALLSPVLSRPVTGVLGWPVARLAGTVGRMSRDNARRNPRRTAATASALMIGLALVAMVSVLAQSTKASVDRAFDQGSGADYTLRSAGMSGFSPEAIKAVRAVPGVRNVTPVHAGMIKIGDEKLPVLVADPFALAGTVGLQLDPGSGRAGGGLFVERVTARELGWQVGAPVPVEYPDGVKATVRVAGLYAGNQSVEGAFIMAPAGYRPHASGDLVNAAFVDVEGAGGVGATTPGGDRVRGALEAALTAYPNVRLQDRQQAKAGARKDVNGLLSMIIVLLALSIVIAALGIVNTLALSVVERTREIGLLRAVGMSRRQLRRMVRYESVVIAVFGAVLGLGLGVGFGCAFQRALSDQGVDVLSVPVGQLLVYMLTAAAIGVVAAIWPAWRAARMDVLHAITAE